MDCLYKRYWFFFFLLTACVEPYQFLVEDNAKVLVVEGFISDKSYLETLDYPSDGRFFLVKLSYTSNVTNRQGEVISGASVFLYSSSGECIPYIEQEEGEYLLLDKGFKAQEGIEYKVSIILPSEEEYESDWQAMPEGEKAHVGEISFDEQVRDTYVMVAGEQQIQPLKVIAVFVDVPNNTTNETVYYRWDFEPTWVYKIPPTALFIINPICWIRSETYLNEYVVRADEVGGYKNELFTAEIINNDRFFELFSLLVRQFRMNEGYYQFLNEMQARMEYSVNDTPPYNLFTNLKPVNHSNEVVGYFGVVQESATRWNFNIRDLSYYVKNNLSEVCDRPVNLEILSHCEDCLLYPYGEATLEKPDWWPK